MYIAASLAIVFFSTQNIDKFEKIDVQENHNIEISENANNEEVKQSPMENSNTEDTQSENDNIQKVNIVSKTSDDVKANISVPKKKESVIAYSMEPSVDDQKPTQNIQTVQNEQSENNNIMSIQMASDEPLKQKSRSINQLSLENQYQKNVELGGTFDIILQNPKGTKYSMVCDGENGLIELTSQSISENEEINSYTWKFKAFKEGNIKIKYILSDKVDEDKVYNEVVYEINIQK